LFLNDELDLIFDGYFSEPFDNDAYDLFYTKDNNTWPTWLTFYPEKHRIVGIANYTQAAQTLTIRATDKFGEFAELDIIITVVSPQYPQTYNNHTNLRLKGNSTFVQKFDKRIFDDFEQKPLVIFVQRPGSLHTDIQLVQT